MGMRKWECGSGNAEEFLKEENIEHLFDDKK
jgi:hypothetical protein